VENLMRLMVMAMLFGEFFGGVGWSWWDIVRRSRTESLQTPR
jgi:hypothetical protein